MTVTPGEQLTIVAGGGSSALTYTLPPTKTFLTVDLQPSSGHEIDGDPVARSYLDAAIEAGPKTFNFAYAPISPAEYQTSVATASVYVRKVNVRSTVTLPSTIISATDPFSVQSDFNYGANYDPVPQGMNASLHANPTESRTVTSATKTWSAVIGPDGAASFEVPRAPVMRGSIGQNFKKIQNLKRAQVTS